MNSTPQSASGRVGGWRIAPDIAPWPRGSRISSSRRSSQLGLEPELALEHRRARERAHAARDDAGRHALRVRVDGGEVPRRAHAASGRAGAPSAASAASSTARCSASSGSRGGRHRPADEADRVLRGLEVLHELGRHVEPRERQQAR